MTLVMFTHYTHGVGSGSSADGDVGGFLTVCSNMFVKVVKLDLNRLI